MIRCRVPFCPKTKCVKEGEWLCDHHWKEVPRNQRRVFNRARKEYQNDPSPKNQSRMHRLWDRCVTSAIERSVGI